MFFFNFIDLKHKSVIFLQKTNHLYLIGKQQVFPSKYSNVENNNKNIESCGLKLQFPQI